MDLCGHHHHRLPPQPGPFTDNKQQVLSHSEASPYKSVLYFCNWAIYGRKHFPEDIPAARLTHVLYAFCNVNPSTGEVGLTDKWADLDCAANSTNQGSGGCLGRFAEIRQNYPNLKILLSIGGWSYSQAFGQGVSTPERRRKFVESALTLMNDHNLDGLDLDWEYPNSELEASIYVEILRMLRMELDAEALRQGLSRHQFDLSIAAPAGPQQVKVLKIHEMDPYLSFWNLMAYDFAGPWSSLVQYQSNLYGEISADGAVKHYISQGVDPKKIVLGMPVYGRAFANTQGLGQSFSGTGEGSWEQGVWDYKALPLNGSQEHVDDQSVSAYCYDSSRELFVCYDNAETVAMKAEYAKRERLGGGMWWESSADYPVDNPRSLIGAFTNTMGSQLENKLNIIYARGNSTGN